MSVRLRKRGPDRARRSRTRPLLACGHACTITSVASTDRVAFAIAGLAGRLISASASRPAVSNSIIEGKVNREHGRLDAADSRYQVAAADCDARQS